MNPKNAIMVNDMMLGEYLRDNESIEEEIKSKEFIKEGFNPIQLKRHIREKYETKPEKNGEVKILGQYEINLANYPKRMEIALKREEYKQQLILVLLISKEEEGFLNLTIVADKINEFAKQHNIRINEKKMRHAVRGALGWVIRSKLYEHMVYHNRNTPENNKNHAIFMAKESLRQLDMMEAIELGYKRHDGKAKRPMKTPVKKIDKDIVEETQTDPVATAPTSPQVPDTSALVEAVLANLKTLSNDAGSLFNFSGDLVINININSK